MFIANIEQSDIRPWLGSHVLLNITFSINMQTCRIWERNTGENFIRYITTGKRSLDEFLVIWVRKNNSLYPKIAMGKQIWDHWRIHWEKN